MNERGFMTESDRVHRFLTLLRTKPNEEAYQRCLQQLDEYVTAQLNGEPYLEQFGDLAVLLDAHPDCAEAYALLHEMITADLTRSLPQPDHIPRPDLSFLRASAPNLLAQLSAAIQQTADTISLTLTEALIGLLQPPTPAPILRAAESERYGEKILQLQPEAAPDLNIPFSLNAYLDKQEPDSTLIELIVQPPGKSWPELAGYRVAIRYDGQLQQATTDAWGVVSFGDIPVAQLANLVVTVNVG